MFGKSIDSFIYTNHSVGKESKCVKLYVHPCTCTHVSVVYSLQGVAKPHLLYIEFNIIIQNVSIFSELHVVYVLVHVYYNYYLIYILYYIIYGKM